MLYISFNESPIFWLSLKHFAKTFILCFYGFQTNFVKKAKAICICILVQKVWHLFFPYDAFLLRHKVYSNGNIYMHIYMYMYWLHSSTSCSWLAYQLQLLSQTPWFITTLKVLEDNRRIWCLFTYCIFVLQLAKQESGYNWLTRTRH